MGFVLDFFNVVLVDPMINILIMLYIVCSENFGLAIIVFTFIVRGALTPLSVRQSKQFKAMASLQPKLKSLQEKFKNDRSRISSETMKLYRDNGVSPIGCLGPTLLQMPVFFALFWALRGTLPSTPENLTKLSEKLYSWLPGINQAIPINDNFLGLSLGKITTDNPLTSSDKLSASFMFLMFSTSLCDLSFSNFFKFSFVAFFAFPFGNR